MHVMIKNAENSIEIRALSKSPTRGDDNGQIERKIVKISWLAESIYNSNNYDHFFSDKFLLIS